MEFHSRLAQFVISNTGVMRCWLAANFNAGIRGNTIHSDEKWERQMGRVVWKRGVPQKVLKKRGIKSKSAK